MSRRINIRKAESHFLPDEMWSLVEAFDYGLEDLRWYTINAMKSAFLPFDERLEIIERVVKPGYAQLIEDSAPAR